MFEYADPLRALKHRRVTFGSYTIWQVCQLKNGRGIKQKKIVCELTVARSLQKQKRQKKTQRKSCATSKNACQMLNGKPNGKRKRKAEV